MSSGILRPFCFVKPDIHDLISLTGLLMLAFGLYLISPPLALIVPGALLLAAGVIGARP